MVVGARALFFWYDASTVRLVWSLGRQVKLGAM
jgi:hypothetical protein